MGKLTCIIMEARNLHNPQMLGSIDPYVKIKQGNNVFKTEPEENTTEPHWEARFVFQVADENSAQIEFEMWNKNLVSDDFLGKYTLSLSGLVMGQPKDEWYLLQQSKSNAELRVVLTAEDFGQIPSDDEEEMEEEVAMGGMGGGMGGMGGMGMMGMGGRGMQQQGIPAADESNKKQRHV